MLIRFAGIFAAVGLGALCWAAPASASVTLGQLEAGNPPTANCNNGPVDQVVTAVASGPSYLVPPGGGVITSWSHNAAAGSGQMFELKLFRNVSGSTFQVVAHDGPRSLTPSILNTFLVRIPVGGGEIVGTNDTATANSSPVACNYHVTSDPANALFTQMGDLADSQSGTLSGPVTDERTNVSAVLEADADHDGFGDETQDKCVGTPGTFNGCPNTVAGASAAQVGKKPRVIVTVTVPGAGTLKVGAANDASVASASAVSLTPVTQALTSTSPQQVPLTLSLTKSAKKKLRKKGKLKLQVKIAYTPPGGTPGSRTLPVKLKSKRKK